ncbi:acyl-ACP--UDP-N-acetylglucosamine O-acyltransferase [Bartonella sp. TP]|uniref:acyl-ACP--UDP-N-acetylglucosamine O-acyltransferase n=1 Tax=Bartonella sp. TP TaxID=3057550 RepID=UPI0025B26545|nr:acyl-ACP--UDP-N-acetylglucosamine O-acyltransferase [Bartonella sp. TP]MDN5248746.1 acyl-ACP--UDP-N-acetylglucosamine O-acyltransferase [Alphaproteobacteria bacterium]WJW79879.1 acyl-ACP--UDP-N-acetylglucosamine O-acyltransferase [Bartonella sp. TP]
MCAQNIHSTAFVAPAARLGSNVKIGPFTDIGPEVEIGDDCEIMSHVVITGTVKIGAGAKIYPHAVLGCEPQNNRHRGGKTALVIGRNCTIREGVTMHRGSDDSKGITVIGDNCLFLAYAHVAHDCIIGNNVTFANNVMVGGHVEIGDRVIIGGGGAVHQFVRVGHHAFVGGLAALVNDLIPYGSAIGVNAHLGGLNLIGMRRANMPRSEIHNVRHAVEMLFDRTKTLSDRVIDVGCLYEGSPAVQDLLAFLNIKTKRSYCTPLV